MQWESELEKIINNIPDNITANEIVEKTIHFIKQKELPKNKIIRIFNILENEYENNKKNPSELLHLLHLYTTNYLKALEIYIKQLKYNNGFLSSIYWKIVRDYILWKNHYRCVLCKNKEQLNVHHRDYENHGLEHLYLDDLIVLCQKCHSDYHKIKKRDNE